LPPTVAAAPNARGDMAATLVFHTPVCAVVVRVQNTPRTPIKLAHVDFMAGHQQ
jgi:hypothetical protein